MEQKTCTECDGDGEVPCPNPDCASEGQPDCADCQGRGNADCPWCGGSGFEPGQL